MDNKITEQYFYFSIVPQKKRFISVHIHSHSAPQDVTLTCLQRARSVAALSIDTAFSIKLWRFTVHSLLSTSVENVGNSEWHVCWHLYVGWRVGAPFGSEYYNLSWYGCVGTPLTRKSGSFICCSLSMSKAPRRVIKLHHQGDQTSAALRYWAIMTGLSSRLYWPPIVLRNGWFRCPRTLTVSPIERDATLARNKGKNTSSNNWRVKHFPNYRLDVSHFNWLYTCISVR